MASALETLCRRGWDDSPAQNKMMMALAQTVSVSSEQMASDTVKVRAAGE